MKCPICKKDLENLEYRPFCCKRCADVDLGNWFGEKYSIAAVELDDVDDADIEKLADSLGTEA